MTYKSAKKVDTPFTVVALACLFNFRASQLSTNIALSTLEYLNKELEYVPWVAAQRQLSYLDSMLSKTDMYGQFEVKTMNFIFEYDHS